METLTAIKTRQAVRNWSNKYIPQKILNKILEAGRWAPSPLNSSPWNFTIIRKKETLEKLVSKARRGDFLVDANAVIVVTVDNNVDIDKWLIRHKQHIYSGVCAIDSMWLATWDLGLGACWVTIDEKTTRKVLSIPDNQVLLGSLAIGYPAEEMRKGKARFRRPLSELIYYEKFGNKKKK